MNAQQRQSLMRLLDYLAHDEHKHFESAPPEERVRHIHLDIQILQEYLNQQQGDPNS